jgi:hypothetical protein
MKPPSIASQKKVTAENLVRLGPDRLAEILAAVAQARPDLKRRLRMELAAQQGTEHLALEIDKRLSSFETSRSRIAWRQKMSFIRDLDVLRALIAERLAPLDRAAALERLWRFMGAAPEVGRRMRDRDGSLAGVFQRAARDIGALVSAETTGPAAEALADAVVRDPGGWIEWLPDVLAGASPAFAQAALRSLSERPQPTQRWLPIIRKLADAAGDVDAFRSTFTDAASRTPHVAADIAQRLLAASRVAEAGQVLQAASPSGRKSSDPDFDWETAWIDYLERSGDQQAAQAARWSSFERTLSVGRARDFVGRLEGFDDVEAEARAFEHALRHPDFERALAFLMDWPALPEAARLILARPDDVEASPEAAELWAAKLTARQPAAAHLLLRKVAAAAFRRRDFATCDRLSEEADAIAP